MRLSLALLFAAGLAAPALAETPALTIYKNAGAPPAVTADTVDAYGAQSLRIMLGEDFLVLDGDGPDPNSLPDPADFSDDDDPFPTQCYCPEDYTAFLRGRIQQLGRELRPQLGLRVPVPDQMTDPDRLRSDPAILLRLQRALTTTAPSVSE